MPDFSLTKVYRIVSESAGLTYVGSTAQERLSSRMSTHRAEYKRWMNKVPGAKYCTSFEVMKNDDAQITLLQAYSECKSSDEKRMYEQEWQDRIECVNIISAYTSEEEKKQYHKEYNSVNREELNSNNCKYYQGHRDEVLRRNHDHYIKHREEISQRRSELVYCDVCKRDVSRNNISTHEKTQKHFKNSFSSAER